MSAENEIRKAQTKDYESIWKIIKEVISKGDTYVFLPNSVRNSMLSYWCGNDKHTYVALINKKVVGTFIIKDNFPGLGSHVANASYMTLLSSSGLGVGTAMGVYSLKKAAQLGYKAMQFNLVVKSNHSAIRLWKKLGFEIKGEIPDAFDHQLNGLTDAYIMWRKL